MVGLLLIVALVILIYAIKADKKREAKEQAAAERRRGEEILRARAERVAKEQKSEKSAASQPSDQPGHNDNYVEKTYRVAGTSFREEAIESLGIENSDYDMTKKELVDDDRVDERIWEFEFFPSDVQLVPEPDNPYDPNAIKVVVDGVHVGYIKAGSCNHVLKLIQEDRIAKINCEIGGGRYKVLTEEYDDEKDKDVFTIDRDKTNYFVSLTIRELVNK